jgi:hypothetical protein
MPSYRAGGGSRRCRDAAAAPVDDAVAQVRAKLLRLARAQGLIPPEDAPAADIPAAGPDLAAPAGDKPHDDPIAQVREKLARLARAQGLTPPVDPTTMSLSQVRDRSRGPGGSRLF